MTVGYPPSANKCWRRVGNRTLLSADARAYRAATATAALQQGMRPLKGNVVVVMEFYRPQKSGDVDNRIKQLLDALRGVGFEDDKQVVEITARRFEDKANPRAVVTVTPAVSK